MRLNKFNTETFIMAKVKEKNTTDKSQYKLLLSLCSKILKRLGLC